MSCRIFGAVFAALLMTQTGYSGTVVQFRTSIGDFEVELYDNDKPVTAGNFLRYVTNGLYADSIFHRGVGNFVIQGGGFWISNRTSLLGYSTLSIPTFPQITNEFKVGPFLSNVYGTIAMAKTSDPNSATSQFFINLVNNSASLDNTNNSGGFTVFGRVIGGTNILNRLNASLPTTAIQIVNVGGAFAELPLLISAAPPYIESNELVYVDISVLAVKIKLLAGGSREISWNSISNRVNYVECTTNLPPAWTLLTSTNGTGGQITVLDNSTFNPSRFYRIRIAY
jgi:cyclophilin family peptidyl-prolyl cis-trans isomerase